jgi:23S rRNA (cytosine1962-C5)-methyltransferase
VLLCLNAPELDTSYLQDLMQEAAPEFTFVQRVANPPSFADVSPERALKVLLYKAPASYAATQTV